MKDCEQCEYNKSNKLNDTKIRYYFSDSSTIRNNTTKQI